MTTPKPELPYNPFRDQPPPEPFYSAPEFRRFAWLAGLVAILGIGLYLMQASRTEKAESDRHAAARKATEAFLPAHELTPEEIEQRKANLLTKFEGALTDTDNGSPLVQQTPGFWKLLEVMIKFSPEEVDRRANLEFDYATAMKDPDALRGEFVRARGILIQPLEAVKLARPVLGRTDFYRGVLTDGDNPFLIDLTERPEGLEDRGVYDVEGVFYRTVTYKANDNSKQTQPLLVVRNMRKVDAATETGWRAWMADNMFSILVGMAILVFGGRLVLSIVQGKRRHNSRREPVATGSFHQMFDQKLRADGLTPPPPHPTPPGKSDGH